MIDVSTRKDEVIEYMITRICQDGKMGNFKTFFHSSATEFLGEYIPHCSTIFKQFKKGESVTEELLKFKFDFTPKYTKMTTKEIALLLKEMYIKELCIKKYQENVKGIKSDNLDVTRKFLQESLDMLNTLEEIQMVSMGDKETTSSVLKKMRDRSDILTFGHHRAFNHMEMRLGQLVGVLGASGGGKSYMLQKLHVESKQEVVLHFSLELNQLLWLRRMMVAYGLVADDQIEFITDKQIEHFSEYLSENYPHWYYTCQDTDSGKINIGKIEKMIKFYKAKHPDKKMKVFIDYVQLLDENFDANSCRVGDDLHKLAVKNNVLIVTGLQGDNDATKYGKPAETSMIAFVKSLKNGFDIIFSVWSTQMEALPHQILMQGVIKKHRMGKFLDFTFLVDTKLTGKDNWVQKGSVKHVNKDEDLDLTTGENKRFSYEEHLQLS